MATNRTFTMIKPEAVAAGNTGAILNKTAFAAKFSSLFYND